MVTFSSPILVTSAQSLAKRTQIRELQCAGYEWRRKPAYCAKRRLFSFEQRLSTAARNNPVIRAITAYFHVAVTWAFEETTRMVLTLQGHYGGRNDHRP
jgi:hypothetical protein